MQNNAYLPFEVKNAINKIARRNTCLLILNAYLGRYVYSLPGNFFHVTVSRR